MMVTKEMIERAISNSEHEQLRKAFEKKKQERLRKYDLYLEKLDATWDACDTVWIMEKVLQEQRPRNPEDEFSEAFIAALRYIDDMRYYRDRMIDETEAASTNYYAGEQKYTEEMVELEEAIDDCFFSPEDHELVSDRLITGDL